MDEPETAGMAVGTAGLPLIEEFQGTTPETYAALVRRLVGFVQLGDCLLFKASNSVGLNRVVKAFCDLCWW